MFDDFKRFVEARFDEQRLFNVLMIRGFHHMTTAFDRLSASVLANAAATAALTDQVATTDTELAAVVTEMRALATANAGGPTEAQLNALADKIDATAGNASAAAAAAKAASDEAGAALGEVANSGSNSDSGGNATDSVNGDAGDDSLNGGNGGDSVATAPVAVVSTADEHVGDSGADSVIVTDHPNGDVLVTPVTSTGDVPAGVISVDPATGVPSSADEGVTLGETTVATDATTSAADLAAADPSAVVSAPAQEDPSA